MTTSTPSQRRRQAFSGDHVDAVRAGYRHYVVPPARQHVDYMASDPSGRPATANLVMSSPPILVTIHHGSRGGLERDWAAQLEFATTRASAVAFGGQGGGGHGRAAARSPGRVQGVRAIASRKAGTPAFLRPHTPARRAPPGAASSGWSPPAGRGTARGRGGQRANPVAAVRRPSWGHDGGMQSSPWSATAREPPSPEWRRGRAASTVDRRPRAGARPDRHRHGRRGEPGRARESREASVHVLSGRVRLSACQHSWAWPARATCRRCPTRRTAWRRWRIGRAADRGQAALAVLGLCR